MRHMGLGLSVRAMRAQRKSLRHRKGTCGRCLMRRMRIFASCCYSLRLLVRGQGSSGRLRWRDLDLDNGKLNIGHRVDAYGEEGAPKSAAGVRTVPLSNQLTQMLREWKLKSKFKKPDDLIFPNSEGNYIGHDNLVKRRFLPLFDKLEVAHKNDPAIYRRRHAASIGMRFGTSPCHVGSRPA